MTVSTEVDHNDYIGNGVTTSFPYTFRIFKKSDLVVQVADLSENITELVLDTDYTVTGAGEYTGGNVILSTPLTSGYQISISRELPVTQEIDFRNQGKFFAEVHEDGFDKLTMLIQQAISWLRLSLRKPSFVANYYDALNNYIRNLRDPSRPQDAATKNYVDSVANTNLSHTLRTPEAIPSLPGIEQRKNKIVAMNDSGDPIMVLPESGSAADVLIELAKPTGAELIGTLSSKSVQQELMIKTSSFPTLQDAANYAVNGIIVDDDYHFTDGETVDFSGKKLTIECKAKFIGDGKLTFENLGSGSRIVHPHMQSQTVPYVISRWDSNGEWITEPSTIISTLTQSRTQGYAPTVNDVDIYNSLPDNVKNQNLISHLIISNSSGIDVFYPKATFGSYESFKNNNVKFWYPRDFYGDMSNCIAFTAWDSTDYYHGNYVIGGSTNYGSGSGVCFYRNDGGVGHDGGVIGGFTPYRCGESGVKTYQNEVNGISQRCYNLRFIDINPIETYYDGVDLNADYGTPTERQHDYTLAQYAWNNLPTNHIVSNIQAYKTHGVGIWGDGSTGFYRDIYASYSRGAGIFIKGSGKNFKNLTSIQNNAANTPGENQITLDGANIIDGVNIINYTQPTGLAIFAPNSTVTNLNAPSVPSSSINIGNIEGLVVGNLIHVQPNLANQTSAVYLNVVNTSVASKREDTIKIGPGASEVTRYVISGSSPRLTMRENHGDFGAVNIAFSGTVLPDEAVPDANSYAVYWDGTNLTALINHGGVLTRQKLTT